jgi:hypothetical protein
MMYNRGWVRAVFTYRCKWCTHEEVVTITEDVGYELNWIMNGATGGMDLCSTDCQKEQDACIRQVYAALEPQPQYSDSLPPGFEAKFQELRYAALKVRGLSHRITRAKLL